MTSTYGIYYMRKYRYWPCESATVFVEREEVVVSDLCGRWLGRYGAETE